MSRRHARTTSSHATTAARLKANRARTSGRGSTELAWAGRVGRVGRVGRLDLLRLLRGTFRAIDTVETQKFFLNVTAVAF